MTYTETNTISFDIDQKESYKRGVANRQRLIQTVKRISPANTGNKYRHTYLFSPAGLGKSFSVLKHLEENKIDHRVVSGNFSMFAFGIQLAVISYTNPKRKPLVIFVDDCDELFRTEANCNTMKNAMHGITKFTYEKSLASQWTNLSDIQKEAIQHFQGEGKMGFEVPTNNMTFVFASNYQLPVDDDVLIARKKGQVKSTLLAHKNAIRSRMWVRDFNLSQRDQWGWIADVVLNTNCLDQYNVSIDDKLIILDFVWNNWRRLTERSIRLVEKMVEIMIFDPETYLEMWELDFTK